MIRADLAIARLRRDLTMGSILKWGMLAAVIICILVELSGLLNGALLLGAVGIVWLFLSYRSVKGSRLTAELPMLIAAGEFDRAEHQLGEALNSFSIYRGVKLRGLHQLALLRHAQRRYAETVILCRWLLGERLGPLAGLSRSARLILADSMLELGDLRGAYDSLRSLYRERLPLAEALKELTAVQTDYLARIGAWQQLAQGLGQKVELAELMPPARSARVQAMLALAARESDNEPWATWLKRRVELLADVKELVAACPVLRELWTMEGDK